MITDNVQIEQPTIRIETPAAFGRRLVASFVDELIISIVSLGLSFVVGSAALGTILSLVINLSYFWFMTGWLSSTPGKKMLGIELRHDSGRVGFGRAFRREVIGKIISVLGLGLGFLWIAIDPQKRGWHDMIAGTRAIRVETVPWSMAWEESISVLLQSREVVDGELLKEVPPAWRSAVLAEYARRHPDAAAVDNGVLRRVGQVEVF